MEQEGKMERKYQRKERNEKRKKRTKIQAQRNEKEKKERNKTHTYWYRRLKTFAISHAQCKSKGDCDGGRMKENISSEQDVFRRLSQCVFSKNCLLYLVHCNDFCARFFILTIIHITDSDAWDEDDNDNELTMITITIDNQYRTYHQSNKLFR